MTDLQIRRKLLSLEGRMDRMVTFNDDLLKPDEVAEILKIHSSTAYVLFNDPSFPGKKIPNVGWRVRKSKLFEYIDKIEKL